MSVKIMSDVFQKSKTEGNARLVLLALADCANPEGVCYPSIKTIASMANISEETTRKYLHAFEKIGLIRSEERFTPIGRRTSNNYHINLEKIGDDVLDKESIYSVVHKSRHRSKNVFMEMGDGMNQSIGLSYEPVHTYPTMNGVQPSYMNRHKEQSIEPSNGFVADAPETIGDDLFPNLDSANTETPDPRIADRSAMASRPLQSKENLAAFQKRANRLLGRRETTNWSASEIRAAKANLETCEEDWKLLEKYYANRGKDGFYTRRSMLTLLNNWAGEIDKSRAHYEKESENEYKCDDFKL